MWQSMFLLSNLSAAEFNQSKMTERADPGRNVLSLYFEVVTGRNIPTTVVETAVSPERCKGNEGASTSKMANSGEGMVRQARDERNEFLSLIKSTCNTIATQSSVRFLDVKALWDWHVRFWGGRHDRLSHRISTRSQRNCRRQPRLCWLYCVFPILWYKMFKLKLSLRNRVRAKESPYMDNRYGWMSETTCSNSQDPIHSSLMSEARHLPLRNYLRMITYFRRDNCEHWIDARWRLVWNGYFHDSHCTASRIIVYCLTFTTSERDSHHNSQPNLHPSAKMNSYM